MPSAKTKLTGALSMTSDFDRMRKDWLREALEKHSGNRKKAAAALGVSERTVYLWLKKWPNLKEK